MRCRWSRFLSVIAPLALGLWAAPVEAGPPADATALYAEHCAECHGSARLGGVGPALLPENLKRLRKKSATAAIADGRPATQMPAFADVLTADEIGALTDLIYTPLPAVPQWSLEQMQGSHVVHNPIESLPEKPVHDADPLNLFTVVEAGDHHVTILDGDTFEPLWRFPSRFALHGGAKYSPDGRFVYLGSRDGWISKYDLYSLKPVAEIRAGINTRNIAVSGDGKWVMVGNFLPHTLVVRPAPVNTAETMQLLREELENLPETVAVQVDTDWVQRFHAILDIVDQGIGVGAVLLGLAIVVIIGNTIRLDVENRRDEIEVTKLIGASDAFVRRPFLWSGLWYGLLGGLLAVGLVEWGLYLLDEPVARLAGLYQGNVDLLGLSVSEVASVIGIGAGLGLVGSWFAATRRMRVIEPG